MCIVGSSKEYKINAERSVTCQMGVFGRYRGSELKKLFARSTHTLKTPFQKNSVIDLWLITFTLSRTIRKTTSFYPQLSYFHFLYCGMKCCWLPLLELARQPLFVSFGKLQNFNYLHPLNNNLCL